MEAEAEAEAEKNFWMEAEAEAEAKTIMKMEAEAEAVQKFGASTSLEKTIIWIRVGWSCSSTASLKDPFHKRQCKMMKNHVLQNVI